MTRHSIARIADLVGSRRSSAADARSTHEPASWSRSMSTPRRDAHRAGRRAARRASADSRSAASCSPPTVRRSCATLAARGDRVFLDLKFHDIPNTVAGAVRVRRATRRVDGQRARLRRRAMMRAARAAARSGGRGRPARARWSSPSPCSPAWTQRRCDEIGVAAAAARTGRARSRCSRRTAGLDGVVASPQETAAICASACGPEFVDRDARASGQRPPWAGDDQARTMTAPEAMAAGASYLVVGRPDSEGGRSAGGRAGPGGRPTT